MPKKYTISTEELDIFQKSIGKVKPIKKDKIQAPTPKVKTPGRSIEKSQKVEYFHLSDYEHEEFVLAEDKIIYHRDGISDRILRKLRHGKYPVESTLDLHRLTREEARTKVDHFIHDSLLRHYRVILIIHGKGRFSQKPMLKSSINQWLREIKQVLAFCSAQPKEGGTGAVYVLLKGDTFE